MASLSGNSTCVIVLAFLLQGTILAGLRQKHPDVSNFARNFNIPGRQQLQQHPPMHRGISSYSSTTNTEATSSSSSSVVTLAAKINRRSPKSKTFFKVRPKNIFLKSNHCVV